MRYFLALAVLSWIGFAAPTPAAPPLPIAYGQTASGQLTSMKPETLYSFNAQAGDVITITMDRVDGVIDPLLILTDGGQQNVLAVDNDSGGDRNARLRFVIPASASYIIKATAVQGGDLNGAYQLALILGNPTPTPSPHVDAPMPRLNALSMGNTLQASLDDSTRFRMYALHAHKGDAISATLAVSGKLQAGLYLYSVDFHELTRAELGAALTFNAPADGLYLLIVARTAESGVYTLTVTGLSAEGNDIPPINGVLLVPGQAQAGKIGERIGTVYTFEAQPGTSVDLTMSGLTGVMILADAAMTEIASSAESEIRGAALPHAGRYAVFVIRQGGPNDTTVGDYTLTLRGTVNPTAVPTATAGSPPVVEIAYGRTVNDAITGNKTLFFYTFQGAAGDVVTIQMNHISGNGLDPLLYLYSYANGQPVPLASSDNSAPGNVDAAIQNFTLPQSGPYLIVATRAGATVGSFILSLNRRG